MGISSSSALDRGMMDVHRIYLSMLPRAPFFAALLLIAG